MLNQSAIASNAKREVEKWQNVVWGRNQRLITPAGHATQTQRRAHAYISSTWPSVCVIAIVFVNGIRCETWPEVGVKDTTCQGWPFQHYIPLLFPFSMPSIPLPIPFQSPSFSPQEGAKLFAKWRTHICNCVPEGVCARLPLEVLDLTRTELLRVSIP